MFKCSSCGYISSKWEGKCSKCNTWGSYDQIADVNLKAGKKKLFSFSDNSFVTASNLPDNKLEIIKTGFSELDRVLGGGIISGAVILLGGDPGVGKSTLMLQALINLAKNGQKVAYISGEESLSQLANRMKRISKSIPEEVLFLAETSLEQITALLQTHDFKFVIIDSAQSITSEAMEGYSGSISQMRTVVTELTRWAKKSNCGMCIISQVTKEGNVAGPKTVEHIVDTVLYIEKVGIESVRLVRAVKNRFGDTGEVGFIEMTSGGMHDKSDYGAMFIENENIDYPGNAFGVTIQGTRPVLVQIQALVSDSPFANPRRVVEGVPKNKLEVLVAVMAKRFKKYALSQKDIFIKVQGDVTIKDGGVDLAIVQAILSSVLNNKSNHAVFIGEVGLFGEIKKCNLLDERIKIAKKLGFNDVVTFKSLKEISQLI